ncbi:hypothetical protein [Shiella aurantiaca]|nr:hypothetical protein [Shiella aurantiaca]
MLCAELSEVLNPEKVIIISSAKNRQELPFCYTFQRIIPLYKLMPPRLLLGGAKMLQPLVEPDRNKNKATFQQMLGAKDPLYMKRSIGMIIRWERTLNSQKIIHIHGDNDHTLPIRRVRSDHVVPNGSHMITLTRFEEVKQILLKELLF